MHRIEAGAGFRFRPCVCLVIYLVDVCAPEETLQVDRRCASDLDARGGTGSVPLST